MWLLARAFGGPEIRTYGLQLPRPVSDISRQRLSPPELGGERKLSQRCRAKVDGLGIAEQPAEVSSKIAGPSACRAAIDPYPGYSLTSNRRCDRTWMTSCLL
jgi:hypothetical protein